MSAYLAFMRKEWIEYFRTYKLLILAVVFVLIGMMNPLTAKLTPVLLKSLVQEGFQITMGEPTAFDSWVQFYKNVPQMGLIVMVILFSSIMTQEYGKGTLVLILTKGLSRKTVILSKFTMAAFLWTVAYSLCFGVSWAYTAYFWSGDGLNNLIYAAFCLWLYGLFLIASIILGSALFQNTSGVLLFTGGLVVVQFLCNIIPRAEKYNPIYLATKNLQLVNGSVVISETIIPVIITTLLIICFVITSISLFNKKSI